MILFRFAFDDMTSVCCARRFMALFGAVFPIMALVAMFINMLELRIGGVKLVVQHDVKLALNFSLTRVLSSIFTNTDFKTLNLYLRGSVDSEASP